MAVINLTTANKVDVVESRNSLTLPAGEAITAGMAVRPDTATGRWVKAASDIAANARVWGIATHTVAAGMPLTVIRSGKLSGWTLDALDYGADIFLGAAGALDTAAGAVSVVVGRVAGAHAVTLGTVLDKIIDFNI